MGRRRSKALPLPNFDEQRENQYIEPNSEIEIQLIDIWQEILKIEKIGINDNFFSLGGHSLLATRVLSRINSQLKIELPLRYLFEYPTIEQLSIYIDMLDSLSKMNDNSINHSYESIDF